MTIRHFLLTAASLFFLAGSICLVASNFIGAES